MVAEGVLPAGRRLPGERYLYGFYNPSARRCRSWAWPGPRHAMKGRSADGVRAAGKAAVEDLIDLVQPWALEELAAHRAEGRLLVLATTSPHDLVDPLASALGFDDVLATRYQEINGRYTGRLVGRFVWGTNKRDAVRGVLGRGSAASTSPTATPTRTASSTCRSCRAVGSPHAINADPRLVAVAMARRWPLEHWDRPPGPPFGDRARALPPAAAVHPSGVVPATGAVSASTASSTCPTRAR